MSYEYHLEIKRLTYTKSFRKPGFSQQKSDIALRLKPHREDLCDGFPVRRKGPLFEK